MKRSYSVGIRLVGMGNAIAGQLLSQSRTFVATLQLLSWGGGAIVSPSFRPHLPMADDGHEFDLVQL